ncbi:Putative inner membrane protein [Salmonella enterica subsp. arizonae]|uniref:Inner membrane protein n=1 Tax=Salmonella enterica subsp. arizonae TaxID=59203 RepID=A0A2X4THG0_SALER|nr:Putative inner membrane protein [Salmonella enterica subsp. arizonae]
MSLQDNDFAPKPAGKWWLAGKKPDYRFTLANERTFLAWIRTALALMAGAVGIDQFFSTTFLSFFKALSGVMSCRRWGGTWWAGVASLAA